MTHGSSHCVDPAAKAQGREQVMSFLRGAFARWAGVVRMVLTLGPTLGSVLVAQEVAPGAGRNDPNAHMDLVMTLQKALQDRNCYLMHIDGDWGRGSRRALRNFLDLAERDLDTLDPSLDALMIVRSVDVACPTPPKPKPRCAGPRTTTGGASETASRGCGPFQRDPNDPGMRPRPSGPSFNSTAFR